MLPRHILVPFDFSTHADSALAYAIPLAQALQARLTLLHVLEPLSLCGEGGKPETEAAVAACLQAWEVASKRALSRPLQQVRDAGLCADRLVLSGTPCEMILDVARARQVGLIIMGTHGRTGLVRALMGSVAERVVRYASLPVLVVPGSRN